MFEKLDGNNPSDVIKMLNMLYASEVVAAQQYWRHANDITGMYSVSIQQMFDEHAVEEMKHADMLRKQIHNLGGVLINDLATLIKINPAIGEGKDVQAHWEAETMLGFDLTSEEQAIANYKEACMKVMGIDPGTYIVLAEILNDEYEHAQEIKNLLAK